MITDALFRQAADRPLACFVETPTASLTYRDAAALVATAAARLRRARVDPGDRVAIVCGNRPAFLVAWLAVAEAGAVAVPLNPALLDAGLARMVRQSGATLLLADPDQLTDRPTLTATVGPDRVVLLDDTFERAPALAPPRTPAMPSPADPCSILFTSGTTGTPKGAVISHDCYERAGTDMAASLGLTPEDRVMVFLPLFHANPQMYAVMSVLEVGATLVVLPRFSASTLFADAAAHRATGFTYVGTVLSILTLRHLGPERNHSLRWCVGGGAPGPVWEVIEERFGIAVRELYGMTETGGWATMNVAGASLRGSVGLPRPGVELAVANGDGIPTPAGEIGEIVVRADSPTMFFSGYWNDERATTETLRGPWLHTGDLGRTDADGFLYFEGRSKDLIRRNGEMISPVEIEETLLRHDQIAECVVAGVPDNLRGEEIMAAVIATSPIAPEELHASLVGLLPSHMLPRYVLVVDELPRTETQKIKRFEVARMVDRATDLAAPR